jgi:hypothetical protein
MTDKRAINLYLSEETIEQLKWLSERVGDSPSKFVAYLIEWEAHQKGYRNRNKNEPK